MSGFSATSASRSSLSPCCRRASANVFASAQVSRKVPPLEASSVIIPAAGGPSRTSSHSWSVKSVLVVIPSPFALGLGISTQVGSPEATGFGSAPGSCSCGEHLQLGGRPADEATDQEQIFRLLRSQRFLCGRRRAKRRRWCARRQRVDRADPAAGDEEGLLPARLDRRRNQADLEASQPLEAAQALLDLLQRLDSITEPRRFLVAEVVGQMREARSELRERAGGERPCGEGSFAPARNGPERSRLGGDDEVLAAAPEIEAALLRAAARVGRRSKLPDQAQLLERGLQLGAEHAPLDPVECEERSLDGGPLALTAEVRPQPGADVAGAADVEHLAVAVAEEVHAGLRGGALGEGPLSVHAALARRGERAEIGEPRRPELDRKSVV